MVLATTVRDVFGGLRSRRVGGEESACFAWAIATLNSSSTRALSSRVRIRGTAADGGSRWPLLKIKNNQKYLFAFHGRSFDVWAQSSAADKSTMEQIFGKVESKKHKEQKGCAHEDAIAAGSKATGWTLPGSHAGTMTNPDTYCLQGHRREGEEMSA